MWTGLNTDKKYQGGYAPWYLFNTLNSIVHECSIDLVALYISKYRDFVATVPWYYHSKGIQCKNNLTERSSVHLFEGINKQLNK